MAWYSSSWLYRIPVTVDNSASVSGLIYFQVPITISGAAYTSFAAHANADGSDIRVTDSDGTTLIPHALEGIDATASKVYLIAKVPSVTAGATRTIYVYYGNVAATSVSSFATTIGPSTALTGPADIYTQVDAANFNANPLLLLLANQGGVHGGGSALNGKILCFILSGAASNADRTGGDLAMTSSTDGGVTFGSKTTLASSNATNMIEPRSVLERADGTILLIYSCDTPAHSSVGKAKCYCAKSTDGGATWSNLSSTAPANQITVWWTYGTDLGTIYGRMMELSAGGDIYAPSYALVSTTATSKLLKCPSGSDPTVGSNWVTQCQIYSSPSATLRLSEPTVLQATPSTHYIAIFRNDTTSGANLNGDLYAVGFKDDGTILFGPSRVNVPGPSSISLQAVSPDLIRLANGNILLTWGVRYGANWGIAAAICTDEGGTYFDRSPALFTSNVGQTSGDGGYPSAIQNPDGSIVIAYYREFGGNVATCNVARAICNEDYLCNANNFYLDCEASDARMVLGGGSGAALSTTHAHNGTKAVKIDNTSGTGSASLDRAMITLTGANSATTGPRVAYSFWAYDTTNTVQWAHQLKDSTGSATTATGNRTSIAVQGNASLHIKWYNGTAYQDTGVVAPQNVWNKHSVRADAGATSLAGQILLNNASVTSSLGQYGNGGNPYFLCLLGASTGSNNNVIYWFDDFYTHQYTPTPPTVTAGSEGGLPAVFYRIYANGGDGGAIDYASHVAETTDTTWTSGSLGASTFTRYGVRTYGPASGLEEQNADAHVDVILDASRVDITRVPFAPKGLVARNVAATGVLCNVRLAWSCPSYDREHLPTGFRIYKGTPTVSYASVVATVPYTLGIQAYSATVAGLTDATSYQFGVRAYNGSGEESNTITATITADATPPSAADSLAGTPTAEGG